MPSKFDKISFDVSSVIVLPVAVGIVVLDVMSGMWKSDLIAMGGIFLLIIGGFGAFWTGTRLRGKIKPTKEMLSMFLQAGMAAIVCDCILVFLAAFTVGYQPWLVFVLLPNFILGVTCLLSAALVSGSIKEGS